MGINATISGNISEVITIKNPTFELLENETRNIDFVTKANNPGVYKGQITVTYTTNVTNSVDIPSDITVFVTGTPVKNNNGNSVPKIDFVTVLIIVLVIIVIALLLVKYKRGSKKWGK
jgi:predicted RND superfamily exporter protein